jgi:predicted small lipoprotein YifL
MRRVPFRTYRYFALALTVLVIVAVLSGCGGKGGGY